MRLSLWVSSQGGSPLVYSLQLAGLDWYRKGEAYDCTLVFNQCAHTTGYTYPEWPEGPIAFVDTAEYGTRCDPINAFAEDALDHDTKNRSEQERLRNWLRGRSFPYFLREMWSWHSYPESYHPIDYPLHPGSECKHVSTREQFLARENDVACIWGLSNPQRVPITRKVKSGEAKADVYVVDEDGPRLRQDKYYARLLNARSTVNYDGYGSSSFRLTEGLVRCAVLQGPLRIRTREPLEDGKTCVAFDTQRLSEVLRWVRNNPERLYDIYRAGYEHCMRHYTVQATLAYIERVIEAHDWRRPTWI